MARILVVDEDPLIRRAVNSTLVEGGHEIDDVNDSGEALKVLACQRVDLVLGDIQMPVLHGHMLFHRVKRIQPGIAFIAMSSYYQAEDFPDLAFDGFLRKPFSCADLMDVVRRILSERAPPMQDPPFPSQQMVL